METNKKRSHEQEETMDDSYTNKKLNISGENTFHLKMLIPSVAAGAIIGKGGETIAEIQKSVGARIKMSKPNDFYPGTSERVCLITGGPDAIATIVHFLNMKIKEKPDPNAKPAIDFDNKIAAEREKQMKVIVPNSTAGMIIGKGGCFIKHLKEKSGAFIQLSQKSKETTLPERVITIIGDDDNNREALSLILEKVVEDPQSGSCLNISYSEIQGPVANFNPTGSPYANGSSHLPSSSGPGENGKEQEGFHLPVIGGGALSLKMNLNPHIPPTDARLMNQYLGHINNSFKAIGYDDKVADEVTKAFSVLSLHGVIHVDLIAPPPVAPTATLMPPDTGNATSHMTPIINMLEGPPVPQHPHHSHHQQQQYHHQHHPVPGTLNNIQQQQPSNQQPQTGGALDPSVITDSLRANMGLPPPPATPPGAARSQGPFGPTGLIHHHHPHIPITAQAAAAAAAAAAASAAAAANGVTSGHRQNDSGGVGTSGVGGIPSCVNNTVMGIGSSDAATFNWTQTSASGGPNGSVGVGSTAMGLSNGPQSDPSSSSIASSSSTSSRLPVNNNSFGLATAGNPLPPINGVGSSATGTIIPATPAGSGLDEPVTKLDMEVNESLVGAVIGQGGRSIVEIQQCSGTSIQISKKGNYSPGTRNRIITITGPEKCLSAAQYLIEQKVAEEELKRQHHCTPLHTK